MTAGLWVRLFIFRNYMNEMIIAMIKNSMVLLSSKEVIK